MEGKTPEVVIKENNTSLTTKIETPIIAQINDSLELGYLNIESENILSDLKYYDNKSKTEIKVKEENDIANNKKSKKQ